MNASRCSENIPTPSDAVPQNHASLKKFKIFEAGKLFNTSQRLKGFCRTELGDNN